MSDDRSGQDRPAPQSPPSDDRTGFYRNDLSAIPTARGPEDMPEVTLGEVWTASRTAGRAYNTDAEMRRVRSAYAPILEVLNEGRSGWRLWGRDDEARPFGNPGEWNGDGYDRPLLGGDRRSQREKDEARIWAEIQRRRAQDPKFMPEIAASLDDFHAQIAKKAQDEAARAGAIGDRARGWAANGTWLLGGMSAALEDPITIATLPMGGGGRTIAQRVLIEGVANAGIEAAVLPITVNRAAEVGEPMTAGGAIAQVVAAGALGAGFQGVVAEPLAAIFRRIVGPGRATETETAALHILDREAEVAASSPFVPGAGSEAHAARLDEVMEAARTAPAAVPPAPSPAPARRMGPSDAAAAPAPGKVLNPASASRDQVKQLIRGAESSGEDLAANSRSTAFGRYQFTARTWLGYYIKRYGRGGLSEEAILARRREPAVQEALMDDLLADNSAALARGGFRQTSGNLYLLHFAGQGGGMAVLRAAPDTPIAKLLGEEAVTANPFLKNKTAADVVAWAQKRMGGGGGQEGPVLRRDQFSTDAEWSAAQSALDAAEAQRAAARATLDAADGSAGRSTVSDYLGLNDGAAARGIDARETPSTWQLISADRPVTAHSLLDPDAPAAPIPEFTGKQRSGVKEPPKRNRPSDVVEFLIDRGGLRNEARGVDGQGGFGFGEAAAEGGSGHALSKGRVNPRTGQRRSGMEWHQVLRQGGPLVRKNGMSLHDAGEILHEGGFFLEPPTEREVLDLIDRGARGEKVYALHEASEMLERDRVAKQADDSGLSEYLAAELGIDRAAEPALFDDVLAQVADGEHPWRAYEEAWAKHRPKDAQRAEFEDPDPDGIGATFDAPSSATSLKGWDDPISGADAARLRDSMGHDVEMLVAEDPGRVFDHDGVDGAPRTVREVLDELDQDARALDAARNCMAPAKPQ